MPKRKEEGGPYTCRALIGPSAVISRPQSTQTMTCGRGHATAEAALRCAKAQVGTPGLCREITASAFLDETLVLLAVSVEVNSQRGRIITCRGRWVGVPVQDGQPDAKLLAQLQRPGLAAELLMAARAAAAARKSATTQDASASEEGSPDAV